MNYKKEVKKLKRRQRNMQLFLYGVGMAILLPWIIVSLFGFYMPMLMRFFMPH